MKNDDCTRSDIEIEKELDRQLKILKFGVVEITPEDEFVGMLRKSIETGVPLRVKCGIDPTSTDVHLGHLVPFRKMRLFQNLGHVGVVIIGDYTASIGDPTGKNESRPALSSDEIKKNAGDYMKQLYTVLDERKTEVCFQTEWFEDVTLKDVIDWTSQTTVAKMLGHETFRERLDSGNSLSLHEFLYPVLQGVDSVFVRADVEIGGTDQKFNILMGRDYQKWANQRPQVAMLGPLLTGTCGTQKMSKSLGNCIAILDQPFDKFGKIMSISDDLMIEYFKYVTEITHVEFDQIKNGLGKGDLHPNETKKKLAERVVSFFHGDDVALEMREKFENVFAKGKIPDDVQEFEFNRGDNIVTILWSAGIISSRGEGRRLIKQNAVGIVNAEKIKDPEFVPGETLVGKVIKVGKRKFVRLG